MVVGSFYLSKDHLIPSDIVLESGFVVSLDFGVRHHDYCSDLQPLWYLRQRSKVRVDKLPMWYDSIGKMSKIRYN